MMPDFQMYCKSALQPLEISIKTQLS